MSIHFSNVPATFIHIPRTGGTSFTSWAKTNLSNYEIAPLMDFSLRNMYKIPDYDWIKTLWQEPGVRFTFVRNPYSRLVSLYHYVGELVDARLKLYKDSLRNSSTLLNFKTQPFQSNSVVGCIIDDTKMINIFNKGFDHWIRSVHENPEQLYNNTNAASHHLIYAYWGGETQLSWFCGNLPDIIIKTENLNQEFYKIQELLGSSKALPHINKSHHSDYRNYYNQETRALVKQVYKDDLEAFDYDF